MGKNTGSGKFINNDRKEDRLNEEEGERAQECNNIPMDLQKKMELRIKALEELLDDSGIIAFIRSPKEEAPLEFVSKGIKAFDYKVEDLISGKVTFKDLIHPDDADRAFLELTENALEGASEHTQTYRIKTKKEHVRVVQERTSIMRDDDGNILYYKGFLEDITGKQ